MITPNITPNQVSLKGLRNLRMGCWSLSTDKDVKKSIIKNPHSCYKYSECEIKQFIANLLNKKLEEIDKRKIITNRFPNEKERVGTINWNLGLEKAKQIIEDSQEMLGGFEEEKICLIGIKDRDIKRSRKIKSCQMVRYH